MNYYEILGINENSSNDEIKKSYRKLSLLHHPDKNNDPNSKNIFNNITEAYSILSDKNLKNNYDMKLNNVSSTIVPKIKKSNKEIISILNYELIITLEQSFNGGSFPLFIERIIFNQNIKEKEKETIYIDLIPGIDNDEIIILNEKGNMDNNGNYGILKVSIIIKKHELFERNGLDLILTKEISFKESICGFEKTIHHFNNGKFILKNKPGDIILNKSNKVIKNKGMNRNGNIGNLIIFFYVNLPNKLNESKLKLLEDIL